MNLIQKIKDKFCCIIGLHKYISYSIYPNIDLDIKGRKCSRCGYDWTMNHWRDI